MSEQQMSEALRRYNVWLNDPFIDEASKQELRAIAGEYRDIEDRFYKELTFGTGGLRGVIGTGSNRMNRYVVGKATQGLAKYIWEHEAHQGVGASSVPSVVIAYDSRHKSPEFALEAALVLAGNGIISYVFESLRPTPELSFAVRELSAAAGIVITASHNPPEYNGYKVYGSDGGQIVSQAAGHIISYIREISTFADIKKLSKAEAESQGKLLWIGEKLDDQYIQAVASLSLNEDIVRRMSDDFRIMYTPLHGAGNQLVRRALAEIGFCHVHVVPQQERPDPQFSTVKSPNPEERDAFNLALELAQTHRPDIIIGTDPDCDRMGALVKHTSGEYLALNGNQAGAIMLEYLLSGLQQQGKLPDNAVMIKTIVTSELGAAIAGHYGVQTLNTLTGFKYIGEKMTEFERTGEYSFVFGYEESYGYLAGTHCRDKDAVAASMLICEAGAYYKSQGKTLVDVLQALYEMHGYFMEALESRTLKGKSGLERMNDIMQHWRHDPPASLNGHRVTDVLDYADGLDGLPPENVLKFKLEDGSWFCLRPSGTEPKIKIYFAVCKESDEQAKTAIHTLISEVMGRVDRMINTE